MPSYEIYPPPKTQAPVPASPRPDDSGAQRRRRKYQLLSLGFMLFAVFLNFSNNPNLISFKAKPDALPPGVSEVFVKLQNFSLMELYISRYYTLERLDGEQWVETASNAHHEFSSPTFVIKKFGGANLTFGSHGVFEPLTPGQYRVALSVVTSGSFFSIPREQVLYAGFAIENAQ